GTSRATREALLQIGKPCRIARRAKLTLEGGEGGRLFFVTEGRVRIERSEAGAKSLLLGHFGRGDLLGDLALTDASPTETSIATEIGSVLLFETAEIRELAARDPGVICALAAAIGERTRLAEERLEGLMRRSVETRIARFLLFAAERWGVQGDDGVVIA